MIGKELVDESSTWSAPPEELVKLNMDASYNNEELKAWCGVVAQDHDGHIIFAARKAFDGMVSPFQAKLRAILFGLEVSKDQHFQVQLVESDCLFAIREIRKGKNSSSEWSSIILDIIA